MTRQITVLLVLHAFLFSPAWAQADGDIVLDERGFATLEEVLYSGDYDIVVATILAVSDSGASQANPPRVTIDVHEVLRGSLPRGVQIIRWMPPPLYMPCTVGEEDNIRRWNAQPMKGPAVGPRMSLGGERDPGSTESGCSRRTLSSSWIASSSCPVASACRPSL